MENNLLTVKEIKNMNSIIRTILLAVYLILVAGPTMAAILTVTKTADTNDLTCDIDCSLREAIFVAAPDDEIRFASPLFDTPQNIDLLNTQVNINKGLTITGRGANLLTARRSPAATMNFRIFNIQLPAGSVVNISGMTISGGIANPGGGISISGGGTTLTSCVITGNTSPIGGGISVGNSSTLNLINSTLSNNISGTSSGQAAAGILTHSAMVNIINSTISGNTVTGGGNANGGAIRNSGGGGVNITNSTITNNSTDGLSSTNAGAILNAFGTVTIRNSIVAGNSGTIPDLYSDIDGQYVSAGYNLIGKNDGAANYFPTGNPNVNNDIAGTITAPVDPRLDPLAMYGGPTPTHRLQTTPVISPAIDKGSTPGGLTTDQRGFSRPFDNPLIPNAGGANADGSDIGGFEAQAVSAVSIGGRIYDASGRAVFGARVSITNAAGETRTGLTNSFGFYHFYGVLTGETYVFQIRHKQYSFMPQVVTINGEINDLNFTAEP